MIVALEHANAKAIHKTVGSGVEVAENSVTPQLLTSYMVYGSNYTTR